MTAFAFTNISAPIAAAVVATLYALDGATPIQSLTLAASTPTLYSGSVTLSPTPPDSTSAPYTFRLTATTTAGGTVTRDIFPAGSVYGFLYGGNWYAASDQAAPGAIAYLSPLTADTIAATLPPTLIPNYLAATSSAKTSALQQATYEIDNAMRYQGRRYSFAQPFEFPRIAFESAGRIRPHGIIDFDLPPTFTDTVWDWDPVNQIAVVPPKVYVANIYQADFILCGGSPTLAAIHGGLKGQSNMGLSESYDSEAPGVDTGMCMRAYRLLKNYRLSSGRLL